MNETKQSSFQIFYDQTYENSIDIFGFLWNDVAIISIYSKPQASKQILEYMISEAHKKSFLYLNSIKEYIFVGDCNIDLMKYDDTATKSFNKLMHTLGFKLLSPQNHSSTMNGTQLDYSFTEHQYTKKYY